MSGTCTNFRDVGEWLEIISGRPLVPRNRILRGGRLTFVEAASEIGCPGTIVNLRKGPDPDAKRFGADYRHFPISNDYEKYETVTPAVRRWLEDVFLCLASDVTRLPILFHCTSGKDRTGVVVAALLLVLGIDRRLIVEEYMLSDGDVHPDRIGMAVDGIGDPGDYFRRVDLDRMRRVLTG